MPFPSPKPRAIFAPARPAKNRRLGWLLFAVIALAGVAFVLTRKSVPPPAVIAYTPRQAQAARAHVDAVRAALEPSSAFPSSRAPNTSAVQHLKQAHGPDLVKLQLSQADLNAYFATEPRIKALLASRHVQAVQMLLKEPRGIIVRATLVRGGHPYNIQIETTLRADPKTGLRVTATGAQVGRLPLPPVWVTAQANKVAGQITGKMKGRLPLVLRDIRVQGDKLILMGVARAARHG